MALMTQFILAQEPPDKKPLVDMFVLAKITVLVHDEAGNPVPSVNLHVRFTHTNGAYDDGYNDFYLKTDVTGKSVAESECTGAIFIEATKDGYYPSSLQYQPADWSKKHERGDQVQPWNPTVPIILKKIGKGVPMYVRSGNREARYFPKQDIEYGFDLIVDDWVAPEGKGVTGDVMLKSELVEKDANQYNVKVTFRFPNKGDGWIPITNLEGVESELKYPREAPINGYREDNLVLATEIRRIVSEELPPGGHPYGYIFRTRTKLNEKGAVVSALHSKIIDSNLSPPIDTRRLRNPILFGGSPGNPKDKREKEGCFFALDYYLNPAPNDRTLEFDRKTNLASDAERNPSDYSP